MLKIRIKNDMYKNRDRVAYNVPEFLDFTGDIVPRPKWVREDQFCLSTGDLQFPFRVLNKDDIVCGWELPNHQSSSIAPKIYNVKQYVVTNVGDRWSCSCVGFGYRKKCSHIDECKGT